LFCKATGITLFSLESEILHDWMGLGWDPWRDDLERDPVAQAYEYEVHQFILCLDCLRDYAAQLRTDRRYTVHEIPARKFFARGDRSF